MTSEAVAMEPGLAEFARDRVRAAVGTGVRRVDPVPAEAGHSVLMVTLAGPPGTVVMKVAGRYARSDVDFDRTAAVSRLARAAGAPVAQVLAVDQSCRAGPWRYLIQERVDGMEWRRVRSLLDAEQVEAAHQQIAQAVLAMQSVRFGSFGDLDAGGTPVGTDLLAALRHRAELHIASPDRLRLFRELLDSRAEWFGHATESTLCHDDLHHANVIFRPRDDRWELAGILDWDKAWAGPAESDVARMDFWDDMTGPGFWAVYRAAVPAEDGLHERTMIYQLLWCLEYDARTPRHEADTLRLCRLLGVRLPP
jgi:aminoglycoside phosphotransferase (APT) family kinase protein